MTLLEPQAEALELARKERHVANGEDGEIYLCRRVAETGGVEPFYPIARSWEYSERDYQGARLPQGVMYELRVAESEMDAAMVMSAVALKHGAVALQIIRPSPFAPSGDVRFWRFWLTPSETITI